MRRIRNYIGTVMNSVCGCVCVCVSVKMPIASLKIAQRKQSHFNFYPLWLSNERWRIRYNSICLISHNDHQFANNTETTNCNCNSTNVGDICEVFSFKFVMFVVSMIISSCLIWICHSIVKNIHTCGNIQILFCALNFDVKRCCTQNWTTNEKQKFFTIFPFNSSVINSRLIAKQIPHQTAIFLPQIWNQSILIGRYLFALFLFRFVIFFFFQILVLFGWFSINQDFHRQNNALIWNDREWCAERPDQIYTTTKKNWIKTKFYV